MDDVQLLCLVAIIAAVLSARAMNYRILRTLTFPLVLFALAGIPDCLATVHFALQNPGLEGNPLVRPFLSAGWLMAAGVFIWVLGWLSAAELAWQRGLQTVSTAIPLALFAGHAWGFSTWLHRISPEMLAETAAVTVAAVIALYYLCVKVSWRGVLIEKKAEQQ
ncbi:MAG: hypothetical protein QXU54_02240 [Candidatus Micrarchaeia archaeon]